MFEVWSTTFVETIVFVEVELTGIVEVEVRVVDVVWVMSKLIMSVLRITAVCVTVVVRLLNEPLVGEA